MKRGLILVVWMLVAAGVVLGQTQYSVSPVEARNDPSRGAGDPGRTFVFGHQGWSGVILDTTIGADGTVYTQEIRIRGESSDRGKLSPVRCAYGLLTVVLTDGATDTTVIDSIWYDLRGAADPGLEFGRLAGGWAGRDVLIDTDSLLDDDKVYLLPYELPGGQEVRWWFHATVSTGIKVYDMRWDF